MKEGAMKAAMVTLCLLLIAIPSRAETILELASTPNVGVRWEARQFAVGLGLGATWDTYTNYGLFGIDDVSIVTLRPEVSFQAFLNGKPEARTFLELNILKPIPIVSSEFQKEFLEDVSDDWGLAGGFGLRSELNDRFRVGGAVDADFTLRTIGNADTKVTAGTRFRGFVQYRL